MTEEYSSISLLKSFVKKIDEIVKNKEYGFSSRAEFVKEAIRVHLQKYGVKFGEEEND